MPSASSSTAAAELITAHFALSNLAVALLAVGFLARWAKLYGTRLALPPPHRITVCTAQHSIATLTATQMAVDLLHALESVAQPIERLAASN